MSEKLVERRRRRAGGGRGGIAIQVRRRVVAPKKKNGFIIQPVGMMLSGDHGRANLDQCDEYGERGSGEGW